MRQLKLFSLPPLIHGADIHAGKRKRTRPLSGHAPVYLTLKAERDFGEHASFVRSEALRLADRFHIAVLDEALNHDHIHLVLKLESRQGYNAYIRSLTGLVARRAGKNIWRLSPFTRVGSWGRDVQTMVRYCEQNRLEAAGLIPYKPRKDPYAKWRGKA